jgi:hypothetical protein
MFPTAPLVLRHADLRMAPARSRSGKGWFRLSRALMGLGAPVEEVVAALDQAEALQPGNADVR